MRSSKKVLAEVLKKQFHEKTEDFSARLSLVQEAEEDLRLKEGSYFEKIRKKEALGFFSTIDWRTREALIIRMAKELCSSSHKRDEAIAALRMRREMLRKSSEALARTIALERGARKTGMI